MIAAMITVAIVDGFEVNVARTHPRCFEVVFYHFETYFLTSNTLNMTNLKESLR